MADYMTLRYQRGRLANLINCYLNFLRFIREWDRFGNDPGEIHADNIAGFWVPFNHFNNVLERFETYVRDQLQSAREILDEIDRLIANLDRPAI